MKWEYFSKRRRISLAEFLKDVYTLEDALQIFDQKNMSLPEDKQLEALFSERLDSETLLSEKLSKLAVGADHSDKNEKPYIEIQFVEQHRTAAVSEVTSSEGSLFIPDHPSNKVEKDAKKPSKKGG